MEIDVYTGTLGVCRLGISHLTGAPEGPQTNMSRYSGYYRRYATAKTATIAADAAASQDQDKVNASTSRETPFYESNETTLRKWREQMQKVFSPLQMGEFEQIRSKEAFDQWCKDQAIT